MRSAWHCWPLEPATAPSAAGVLVIDDTGERKDGHATDRVARQYLGSVGKVDNGIVAVTTLWVDETRYYPLHVAPYTPTKRLAKGRQDAAFRTKPQIALDLVERAQAAGIPFCAIVADCFYGDNNALEEALLACRLPHVLARRATGHWCAVRLPFAGGTRLGKATRATRPRNSQTRRQPHPGRGENQPRPGRSRAGRACCAQCARG